MTSKNKLSRKKFLQIIAVGGTAGLSLNYGLKALKSERVISETRLLMGTMVNIKAISSDTKMAAEVISFCFKRMEKLEYLLSQFINDSQLSLLNRLGVLNNPDSDLVSLVLQAQEISRITQGAFDITVKPLIDLYQKSSSLPLAYEVEASLPLVNYKNLKLSESHLSFSQPDMAITLDGIAKGYIIDEGVAIFQEHGFSNVMVEAGGDLMAMGGRDSSTPWVIGLQSPRESVGNLLARVDVKNQALASSGDYFQSFSSDYRQHHIIDPRIGYSSPELASVTVVAPSVVKADAMATALMVMGEKEGLSLIEKLDGYQAMFVNKKLETKISSGFSIN